MAYVKKVKRDNAQYDIKAVALDAQLDATLLHKSELVNGFTQTTPGVNALDAAAGKSLNDSLANFVQMRYVTATIPANSSRASSVAATIPSGYKFVGWTYCATQSWLGHVYPASSTATSDFYTSNGSSTSARNFHAFYLVQRDI